MSSRMNSTYSPYEPAAVVNFSERFPVNMCAVDSSKVVLAMEVSQPASVSQSAIIRQYSSRRLKIPYLPKAKAFSIS
ncbi:hypothetical protein ES705_46949 [subsurface metagenome]